MKIPLKTKVFDWYLCWGVLLTKYNLAKRNWHGNSRCVFCHQGESIKHLFFQYRFARSIWWIIQVASGLYPPRSVINIFRNWLHVIDLRFRTLITWERLPSYGRFGYIKMIKFLMTKISLSCGSSTCVQVCFVCDHLFSGWRIETCLRRSIYDWRMRDISFFKMDGRIIYGSGHHRPLRHFAIALIDM
jgi:hypothetical protein